jgi:hypothetical protein
MHGKRDKKRENSNAQTDSLPVYLILRAEPKSPSSGEVVPTRWFNNDSESYWPMRK